MLYFLDNVEDGGETAFPVADNITFDNNVSVTLKKQKTKKKRRTGSRLSSGVNTYTDSTFSNLRNLFNNCFSPHICIILC